MSDDIVISVDNVSKAYRIWNDPGARLKSPIVSTCGKLFPRNSGLRYKLETKASRYYRDFYALKDISFQVRKGECVGIIGRNGSGKSTLLQIIAGTLLPTAGSVRVIGRVAALLELGSGFNPDFTGRENVYLNAAVLGLSRAETDVKFDSIAAFADIGDFIDQPVKTYSSGMLMRLAFAVQTAVDPDILIVDEALSVGDEAFQRKCFARMDSLRANGTTVLFVTHAMLTVLEICERAFFFHGGRLLLVGNPKWVVQQYHRLLFSPPESVSGLIDEISKGEALSGSRRPGTNAASIPIGCDESPDSLDQGFFDPELTAESQMMYESCGARIDNPRIETVDGRRVNHLTKFCTYVYAYEVHFDRICCNVRMAHVFKTVSGVELTGTTLRSARNSVPHAEAGQTAQVRIRFKCLLNAGVYLANAGVLAFEDEAETYLHRVIDAVIFRVLPEADSDRSCYVDLEFQPSVLLLSPRTLDAPDRP